MRIAVSGASGLVGSALLPALGTDGHQVRRLARPAAGGRQAAAGAARPDDIRFDVEAGVIDTAALEGIEAVIHLAGAGIAAARWTPRHKEAIRRSRVEGTRLLATALARLERPPRVLVQASAVGFYGDRGDEILTEASPIGRGFLPDTCAAWEAAAAPAAERGVRVVALRFGVILSSHGGALAKMLPPFRLGLGGVVGDGRQWWSWLSIEDAVGLVRHAIVTDAVRGAVNGVAPEPATNRTFTAALGRAVHRPAFLPLPAFAARLLLGEMADALLLSSARVVAGRALETGFRHRHPTLETALAAALAA